MYPCTVDDTLYCGKSEDMDELCAKLGSKFGVHDLGEASTYTGVQVEQTGDTVALHQHDYIVKIPKKYADGTGKSSTSMDLTCELRVLRGQCTDKNLHAMYRSKAWNVVLSASMATLTGWVLMAFIKSVSE